MSGAMSTPLNKLPLKTQNNIESTDNDINDPMVQDVLNEFQEELSTNTISSNNMTSPPSPPSPPIHQYMSQPIQQPMNNQMPSQNNIQSQQQKYNINFNNADQGYAQYVNVDIAKKITIITILVVVIIYSNILHMIYEKLPSSVSEIIEQYDIYIKGTLIFIILYVLAILNII